MRRALTQQIERDADFPLPSRLPLHTKKEEKNMFHCWQKMEDQKKFSPKTMKPSDLLHKVKLISCWRRNLTSRISRIYTDRYRSRDWLRNRDSLRLGDVLHLHLQKGERREKRSGLFISILYGDLVDQMHHRDMLPQRHERTEKKHIYVSPL